MPLLARESPDLALDRRIATLPYEQPHDLAQLCGQWFTEVSFPAPIGLNLSFDGPNCWRSPAANIPSPRQKICWSFGSATRSQSAG